jgi:hypothetical protein
VNWGEWIIKAKAINGIAGVEKGPKRSVPFSLIDHSLLPRPSLLALRPCYFDRMIYLFG